MARYFGWAAVVAGAVAVNAALAVPVAAQSTDQPRLAVVDFEARPGGWTLPPPRVGATVAQLMLNRLVEASQFHVFDGQWLRGASAAESRDSHDSLLAAARDAGVDYIVLGSITQFGMEQQHRTVGGGGLFHRLPIGAASRRETSRLSVSILVRVVNVRTGEVVATATGMGVGKRTGLALGALTAALPLVGGLSRGASGSRDAQLDEATRQAVDAASAALVVAAPRLVASR